MSNLFFWVALIVGLLLIGLFVGLRVRDRRVHKVASKQVENILDENSEVTNKKLTQFNENSENIDTTNINTNTPDFRLGDK